MKQDNVATPPRLTVTAWSDPVIESVGHRPGSLYIELVWLGILGPSATWAWQRLARQAATNPEGSPVDTGDLATSLGLGLGKVITGWTGYSPNAPISRTLGRMVTFGVARRSAETLAVRLALPDVPVRQLSRLSLSANLAHERLAQAKVNA